MIDLGNLITTPIIDLSQYDPTGGMLTSTTSTTTTDQPSDAHSGIHSAYTIGFPGLSDDEVAAMLGMEFTGDRDQDQMVMDAVESARNQNAIATGTYPSQAEIDQRTASFEATMERLRTDPAMREAWGISRDSRRFSIGQILAIAASFAIPFASPAIASAIGLVGPAGVAVTQGTLSAAVAAATGQDPLTAFITGGASGYLSELERIDSLLTAAQGADEAQTIANLNAISDAVHTADQATSAWDIVKDVYDIVQDVATAQNIYNSIRRDDQEEALDSEAPEFILDLQDAPPEEDTAADLEAEQQAGTRA
jgi:hypothetical protein